MSRAADARLSRRGFLLAMGAGLAVAAGASRWPLGTPGGQTGEVLRSSVPLPQPFTVPLPVPPVARPLSRVGDRDLYTVRQRLAHAEILPGTRTEIWSYDDAFPGPTIEARRGRPVVVRHINELPVPTVVHLHGGHTPPDHDGWPLDFVLPDEASRRSLGAQDSTHAGHGPHRVHPRSFDYHYPMEQRAATLWYHDHRMDFTGPAVYRGLAGFHLVRDEIEDALPLPQGAREIPLLVCDRAFDSDGQLAYPAQDATATGHPGVREDYMEGVLGDVILVNGAPWPVAEVDAARYRLRILNASNARRYRFALRTAEGVRLPLLQIGSDGGLLAEPVEHWSIRAAPGERFDVVVDFGAVPVGTEITMTNEFASGRTRDVMRFQVVRRAKDDSRVPARLGEVEPLRADGVRRDFLFARGEVHDKAGWTINGQPFDPDDPIAEVPLGKPEVWRFRTDVHHPVHVHLDSFQVLRRGASGPRNEDAGWKDTVDLVPGETVEVAIRFHDYRGRYLVHCHNLEHEDMAMMTAFRTV